MNVQITFEPDGASGLVAQGTNIWEAAKRLGVAIPVACRGRGECDSCAVVVELGAETLSAPTNAEEKWLGSVGVGSAERLACQAVLEKPGEIRVRLLPTGEGKPGEPEKTLRGLPLKEKIGALIELEAVTITGAVNSLRSSYHSLIDKLLNLTPQTTNEAKPTTKEPESNEDAD